MVDHYPVLYREIIQFFRYIENGYLVDATLGGGGHSFLILKYNPNLKVVGIDRDEYAIEIAKDRLSEFKDRVIIQKGSFKDIDILLESLSIKKASGFLFDLGVSHFQLKLERGFSFQREEFLDMRMDRSQRLTAFDVVNSLSEQQLYRIIRDYSEEKFALRIAKRIVDYRRNKKIETTRELADIVCQVYPPNLRYSSRIHPATRTFQAIRIYVNNELNQLETGLEKAIKLTEKDGIIAVISFHSIEDRIVKHTFKKYQQLKILEVLTKKPVIPSKKELMENPASRSGKLRVVRRL
ncbi:MAG: 16S rRNA (cytosine(1402)-N(4))-methyltransferase RsmH [Hydrogenothermaceae bacterium]|nr:16S rRNA (cytosine(1402)-N(4))-methyltransferase RsmH [Hydrogenothermaceae bacterium]